MMQAVTVRQAGKREMDFFQVLSVERGIALATVDRVASVLRSNLIAA